MKLWPYMLWALALAAGLFASYHVLRPHPGGQRTGVLDAVTWQRMASSGALSRPHAFLEHQCAACHTPVRGVQAANCISCHANQQSLLQRQPTAFHADISECAACHLEHQGTDPPGVRMDHDLLARLRLRELERFAATQPTRSPAATRLTAYVKGDTARVPHASITSREAALDCRACHGNQDRHQSFFGTDCAQCHNTTAWSIPQFRHPPPSSTECAQCHQAPPSHYMMHFEMVSMKVARREHAQVNECYLCHQTTSWNDIKGIGWYKHH